VYLKWVGLTWSVLPCPASGDEHLSVALGTHLSLSKNPPLSISLEFRSYFASPENSCSIDSSAAFDSCVFYEISAPPENTERAAPRRTNARLHWDN
jgi:hypothetical protein